MQNEVRMLWSRYVTR